MAEGMTALLSVAFLLLATPGSLTHGGPEAVPIMLSVENDLSNVTPETYSSSVVEGGVLLGAMRRLQETQHFKFTVKEDPNYGLFLESVNGIAGSKREQTYWEILSESSGVYTPLDVGIGCYQPKANEHIVLRFRTWSKH